MSINLVNPETIQGKVDAAANFVMQIRLAVMLGDKSKIDTAISEDDDGCFMAEDLLMLCRTLERELSVPRCEHCGSDKIYVGPPNCPGCGAPVCCQICCKINNLEIEVQQLAKQRREFLISHLKTKDDQ